MEILDGSRLNDLLSATSPDLLENWLSQHIAGDVLDNDRYWRLVGDARSNAGSIHASSDPVNPIAERIVNAFEAVVELNVQRKKLNSDSFEPTSLKQVLEEAMGIPGGSNGLFNK